MSEFPPGTAPSYGSATRVIQIVYWLHQSPLGLGLTELAERLSVSERTVNRYVHVLQEALVDDDGRSMVETVRHQAGVRMRFRKRTTPLDGSALELLSLFLALDLMKFLEGTLIREGARDLMDRFRDLLQKTGNHKAALMMKDMDRKFFHWSEAPKDYSHKNQVLERLIDSLVRQHHVKISYQAPQRDSKIHVIMPLTLLMYKRGLYVIGRADTKTLTFAVERIQEAWVLETGFAYPVDYDPATRFQHHFGLMGGKAEEIVLRFDAQVAENVVSRVWHPDQRVERLDDGSARLWLHVAPSQEFIGWLLSYGAFVQIETPAHLRQALAARHRAAFELLDKFE
ncbi:MAG: transcriptional regulator [Acidobacteria bacterium]|nr:transcriptional regulator [Acidobacteriota bacterium]